MRRFLRRALPRVLLLLALLGVAHLQQGQALFGVLWRESLLSWDNPATQFLEELASQAIPHADAARQVHERLLVGCDDGTKIRQVGERRGSSETVLCPCITRAPPVA